LALAVAEIVKLYETRGAAQYGSEAVSQLEHALQCAALAEAARAAPALVVASLLHDLGHLIAETPHDHERDADDLHQFLAIPFLRGVLPPAVLEPIRLHVDAKRYLCRAEEGYWDALQLPFAADAVALRRWDDLAKVPGRATPPLASRAQLLRSVAVTNSQ
jgi:predicted HD phosphohydrolase